MSNCSVFHHIYSTVAANFITAVVIFNSRLFKISILFFYVNWYNVFLTSLTSTVTLHLEQNTDFALLYNMIPLYWTLQSRHNILFFFYIMHIYKRKLIPCFCFLFFYPSQAESA